MFSYERFFLRSRFSFLSFQLFLFRSPTYVTFFFFFKYPFTEYSFSSKNSYSWMSSAITGAAVPIVNNRALRCYPLSKRVSRDGTHVHAYVTYLYTARDLTVRTRLASRSLAVPSDPTFCGAAAYDHIWQSRPPARADIISSQKASVCKARRYLVVTRVTQARYITSRPP